MNTQFKVTKIALLINMQCDFKEKSAELVVKAKNIPYLVLRLKKQILIKLHLEM
jgi:hypothetical protein